LSRQKGNDALLGRTTGAKNASLTIKSPTPIPRPSASINENESKPHANASGLKARSASVRVLMATKLWLALAIVDTLTN
jgi:hypothetical protein